MATFGDGSHREARPDRRVERVAGRNANERLMRLREVEFHNERLLAGPAES